MNECPECGGLLLDDFEDDDYTDRVLGMYCPGCGWRSDEPDDDDDYNEHPDFEVCARCGGREGQHSTACSEDDAIWY